MLGGYISQLKQNYSTWSALLENPPHTNHIGMSFNLSYVIAIERYKPNRIRRHCDYIQRPHGEAVPGITLFGCGAQQHCIDLISGAVTGPNADFPKFLARNPGSFMARQLELVVDL